MDEWVADYIRSCGPCKENKLPRYAHFGLLQPLKLAYFPWLFISKDFITELKEAISYMSIWVIVDMFT